MTCPVCRSPDKVPATRLKKIDIARCRNCGCVFMDPMPSMPQLRRMYSDPYQGATIGYYAKAEKKLNRSRKRARMLDRFVLERGSFLDIGASGGFMVEAMHELGYVAYGVEPDEPGIQYARDRFPHNTYFAGFLQDVDDRLGKYDAIYCSEVIEHVPEPRRFVHIIASHLKMQGMLNITTPDVTHWNRPKDLARWKELTPPGHCLLFSPRALRLLLAAHGLELVRHRFNWKAGIQLYVRKVYEI